MGNSTLTLKKTPDPAKISLSLLMGLRYVDRKGRYIAQARVFIETKDEHSWIDIPLCPETYGEPA